MASTLPWRLSDKESACNAGEVGDKGLISIKEDPLGKEVATTPIFLPVKFHRQRILMDPSPWGHKTV